MDISICIRLILSGFQITPLFNLFWVTEINAFMATQEWCPERKKECGTEVHLLLSYFPLDLSCFCNKFIG